MAHPQNLHRRSASATLALVAGLAISAGAAQVALGQDALGDGRALDGSLNTGTSGFNGLVLSGAGRALDNNLRQGSGGWNGAGMDFGSELAYRNAIVTGNVGAGREFRGSVGYTAADDFRGFLGSNAIFRYERDSFYSGLATRNLTGIETLRNPLAYTVAGQRRSVFGGGLIINRSGVGATSGQVDGGVDPRTPVSDMYGNIFHALRSPSYQVTQSQQMPEVIAYRNEPNDAGTFDVMSASPLIGIRSLRSDSPLFNPNQTEVSKLPGTTLPGMTNPDKEADEIDRKDTKSEHEIVLDALRFPVGAQAVERMPMAVPGGTEAQKVPVEPVDPAANLDGDEDEDDGTGIRLNQLNQPKFDQTLENLRSLLLESQLRAEDEWLTEPQPPEAEGDDAKNTRKDDARTAAELAEEILAGKSVVITEFAKIATEGSIFAEHMRRGKELLEAERWFDAEERFTAALSVRPGDPMAAAARVNAQVASGMFRSASVNMRNLYSAYPEMIVTRFAPELLAPAKHSDSVKEQLLRRTELSTILARDCSLLLAYLGYQTGDEETIEEAFTRLDRIVSDIGDQPSALETTLRAIWLNPENQPTSSDTDPVQAP